MKEVRFALVALDTTPHYEDGKTPTQEDIIKEVTTILSRKDLLSRKFDETDIEFLNKNIENFEEQIKKFITPEILSDMVNEIEGGL